MEAARLTRVRYAPSPTGLLHVGNLRTGLFAWLFARQRGGIFVLRIEDTDRARSEARFEEFICRDLRWFGLDWDEGPDLGGPFGPYRQSERYGLYREHAVRLLDDGKAFRCFCSEEALRQQSARSKHTGESWRYPGTCRDLSKNEIDERMSARDEFVIRLRVRAGTVEFDDIVHGETRFSTEVINDPILLRSDQTPTYNYAVVVDDALMEISHVIRGDDHLSNTPKQILIYEAMERPVPRFAHLSTILGPDQTRLSKRHGATSVAQFREAGYLPEALMNYIALLGWSPVSEGSEIVPPSRLVEEFRLDRVNKNPAVFDPEKLKFINRHYLRESVRTPSLVRKQLEQAGWLPEDGSEAATEEWVRVVVDTLITGVDTVCDLPSMLEDVVELQADDDSVSEIEADAGALELIRNFREELKGYQHLNVEDFRAIVSSLKDTTGRKGKKLFHPIRIALTGRASGLELDKLVPLVETGARLDVSGVLDCRKRVEAFLRRHG